MIVEATQSTPTNAKIGSILTFTGTVRESSLSSTRQVVSIEIEVWPEKADEILIKICNSLISDYNLIDARIWHATGIFNVGEVLVHVVIASCHRSEGLKALEESINRYKTQAPVWKKEIYADGSSEWISEQGHSIR